MTSETKAQEHTAETWYVGSMNDGLFIINTPPRPSTDDVWHDRPDGPTMVIPVSGLKQEIVNEIVTEHNKLAGDVAKMRKALEQATQEEFSMARRMRSAIVEARKRLAKGRTLWNGPCHECDAVLEQALSVDCPTTAERALSLASPTPPNPTRAEPEA